MHKRTVFPYLFALAGMVPAASAMAQPRDSDALTTVRGGIALDRFDPSFAGDRMLGIPSPSAGSDLTAHAALLVDYAHDPLVLWQDGSPLRSAVVTHQVHAHLNGTLALWHGLAVNVNMPAALHQSGGNPTGGGQTFVSPSAAQVGDMRLGGRVHLLGSEGGPFQLAVGGKLWLPTGARDSFESDGRARGMPELIAGGGDRAQWSMFTGVELRRAKSYGGAAHGSAMRWGAGFGYSFGEARALQLHAETSGGVVLADPSRRTLNAEVMVGARYRLVEGLEASLGGGPGLSAGMGTPDFRGVMMFAYSAGNAQKKAPPLRAPPRRPPLPARHEEAAMAPPPPDRDADGIIDAKDACVSVAGVKSADAQKNGCPPDRDADGAPDAVDACPDIAGVVQEDPQTNGCPDDTDGDGILDAQDACPRENGKPDPDPKQNGCPKGVRVTAGAIVFLQQVQFDTGKATIRKVSDPLLDEVAGALAQHPEILAVEIQGHTDNRGYADENRALSQQRAEAVVQALVARGIDARRLTPRGYGQEQPLTNNWTDANRQKNRRVEIKILQRAQP